ncbi:hypothetical protein NHX12_014848 [Muraenolepis orangiensis]|uniref:Uncharacterized protein n=1 Tax=Muraenolepis orangiensis TaxID=630683 RepID=A0A9Q0I469_9TELE|nr:hypothetical protein NHX12_014848 [Muraenolepis orangiensis]
MSLKANEEGKSLSSETFSKVSLTNLRRQAVPDLSSDLGINLFKKFKNRREDGERKGSIPFHQAGGKKRQRRMGVPFILQDHLLDVSPTRSTFSFGSFSGLGEDRRTVDRTGWQATIMGKFGRRGSTDTATDAESLSAKHSHHSLDHPNSHSDNTVREVRSQISTITMAAFNTTVASFNVGYADFFTEHMKNLTDSCINYSCLEDGESIEGTNNFILKNGMLDLTVSHTSTLLEGYLHPPREYLNAFTLLEGGYLNTSTPPREYLNTSTLLEGTSTPLPSSRRVPQHLHPPREYLNTSTLLEGYLNTSTLLEDTSTPPPSSYLNTSTLLEGYLHPPRGYLNTSTLLESGTAGVGSKDDLKNNKNDCKEEGWTLSTHRLALSMLIKIAQSCLTSLYKLNKLQFRQTMRDYVNKDSLNNIVDFLHALLGFCMEPVTDKYGSAGDRSRRAKKRNIDKAGFGNNFTTGDSKSLVQSMEAVVVGCMFKSLITRCASTTHELHSSENLGLYCDIRQLVQFIKESHGNVFRRVALSALLDSTEKVTTTKKTDDRDHARTPGPRRTNNRRVTAHIIQCYAPTNDAVDDVKARFYDSLNHLLGRVGARDFIILMGDFNAKIGGRNEGYEEVMGKHGVGKMNDNGEMFVETFVNNNLVIGGSVFPHKTIHKTTSEAGDRGPVSSAADECHSYISSRPPQTPEHEEQLPGALLGKKDFWRKMFKSQSAASDTSSQSEQDTSECTTAPSGTTTERRSRSRSRRISLRKKLKLPIACRGTVRLPLTLSVIRNWLKRSSLSGLTDGVEDLLDISSVDRLSFIRQSSKVKFTSAVKLSEGGAGADEEENFFKRLGKWRSGRRNPSKLHHTEEKDGHHGFQERLAASQESMKNQNVVNLQAIRQGMKRFQFLLNCCEPGTIPDASILAAALDLEAPVVARASLFLECARFVHRCNRGNWPEWMKGHHVTLTKRGLSRGRSPVVGNKRNQRLQWNAAKNFCLWGDAIGTRLSELCHGESESPANILGYVYDEESKRRMKKDDEEEDFLDDNTVNPTKCGCPFALKMAACQLLLEITTFLRETFPCLPRPRTEPLVDLDSCRLRLDPEHLGRQRYERKISFAGILDDEDRPDSLDGSSHTLRSEPPGDDKRGPETHVPARRIRIGGTRLLQIKGARSFRVKKGGSLSSVRRAGSLKSTKMSRQDSESENDDSLLSQTHSRDTVTDIGSPFSTSEPSIEPEGPGSGGAEDNYHRNMSWLHIMILLCNQQSFICPHVDFCPPRCFQHHSRSCARLVRAVKLLYGDTVDGLRGEDNAAPSGHPGCSDKSCLRTPSMKRRPTDSAAEGKKDTGMLKYIRNQVLSLSPAPLSLLIKAAPILTDDMYGDIQPAAWELLLSLDQHMAAVPDVVTEMMMAEFHHQEACQRINSVLKFHTLWRFRYQVWPRMEEGAQQIFKIPPPSINFTLPSPILGMPCVPMFDPPWVPQNTGSVQDSINEDQSKSFSARAVSRSHQRAEHILKNLQQEEERRRLGREASIISAIPVVQEACYEPTCSPPPEQEEEAPPTATAPSDGGLCGLYGLWSVLKMRRMPRSTRQRTTRYSRRRPFHLMEDGEVREDGVAAQQILWNCLIEDPALVLRHFLEKLTVSNRQDELMYMLRKLLLNIGDLPAQTSHILFNYLVGLIMYFVRTPCEWGMEAISATLTFLWEVVGYVEGLFFKDLKQTMKKEQCEVKLLVTASMPGTKTLVVHGQNECDIPTQLPVHEDTQFEALLKECLEFFNIPEARSANYFLMDKRWNLIHYAKTYVRDIYPFRRSVSPQLNLVHMVPEKGQELIQKQVFSRKLEEVGRVLFLISLTQSIPAAHKQSHVSLLQEDLLRLPSFPRTAIDAEFSLFNEPQGKELFGLDTLHKVLWIKLLEEMFLGMPSEYPWGDEMMLFLNVFNGALLLHPEDSALLRQYTATAINTAAHFNHLFSLSGYQWILPTMLQAMEFCCRQFYIMHRKPFVLQLFASVAPLLEFSSSTTTGLSKGVSAQCLFHLLLCLEGETPDTLDALQLVKADKPLRSLDFCYGNEDLSFSVTEAIKLCVTVVAYAPESFRRCTPVLPPPVLPSPVLPSPVLPTPVLPPPVLPTPVLPSPALPTPVLPPPVLPPPVLPTPVLPSPVLPTPVLPTPVLPPPVLPSPVLPTPVLPTPVLPPPVLPSPVLSTPVLPTPVLPSPVLPPPVLPTPVLSTPVLPTPVLPSPVLPTPVLPPPVLLTPVLPSPVLPTPVLPPPVLSPPVLPTPVLPHLFYLHLSYPHLFYLHLSYPHLSYPHLFYLHLSYPHLSYPHLFYLHLSYPHLSYLHLSYPHLFYLHLSYPHLFYLHLSYPHLSYPHLSYLHLSYPHLFYLHLSYLHLSYPHLFYLHLSYPHLFYLHLSYPHLSYPHLSYLHLSYPHLFYLHLSYLHLSYPHLFYLHLSYPHLFYLHLSYPHLFYLHLSYPHLSYPHLSYLHLSYPHLFYLHLSYLHLSYPHLFYLHLSYPHLFYLHLSYPHLFYLHLSYPHLSYPHLSYLHLSYPHLSYPHLSYLHLSYPHLSYLHLSYLHLSYPHLSYLHLSYLHLSYPHLSYPHLSYPHLSYPHLSYLHLSFSHLSYPHLSYPHLSYLHLSYPHLLYLHLSYLHLSYPHLFYLHLSYPHLSYPHLSYLHLSYPHLFYLHLSYLQLSYPHLFYLHLSYPHLFYLHLSYPHLSYPHLSYPHLSYPHLSYPHLSYPHLSYLHLSYPHLSYPHLSYLHLSYPHLFYLHLSYPHLSYLHLSYLHLSYPHLSYPHLSYPHLSYLHLSYPHLFYLHLSYPHLSYLHLSYLYLSYPHLSYPHLSYPHLSYPHLSYLHLSYPHLSYPHLSYLHLSYPHLFYLHLSYPHLFFLHLSYPHLFYLHLSYPHLSYLHLSYPHLSYLHLSYPHLFYLHLSYPHLFYLHLSYPHLSYPHLSYLHLSYPHLFYLHLSYLHLTYPHLFYLHLYPHLFYLHLSYPHLFYLHLSYPHLSYPHLSYLHLSYPHLFYLHLSYPHLSYPHLSYLHLSYPHLSFSHLSYPHLFYLHLSYPHLFYLHLSYPHLSYLHLSYLHLFYLHLSYPHLFYLHLSYPHLSYLHLSYPHLFYLHLSYLHLSYPHLFYLHLSYLHLSYPHLFYLHLSYPHLSYPHLFYLHLSYPHLSYLHLSYPHLFYLHLSYPHLSYPHLSYPHLFYPHLSYLHLSYPHLSYPHLSYLHLSYPHLFYLHLSYLHLSYPHLSYPHLFYPHLSYPHLSYLHLSYPHLSYLHLSYLRLSYPHLSYLHLPYPHLSYPHLS